jgi:mutator protein MutT
MEEEKAFKYCPRCGKDSLREGKIDGLKCVSCSFNFFLNPKPACVAVIFDNENKLIMTKRAINPFKGYWDLPSGFVKKGENAEEALIRELKEELSVDIKIKEYFWSVTGSYPYKDVTYVPLDFCFICTFRGNLSPRDDVADFKPFSKRELPDKISPHHRKIVNELIKAGKLA